MALYYGTDMLKAFKGTAFHDSLESLSQKIKATLPPESMKYLKSVEQTLQVGIKPYKVKIRFAPDAAAYIREKIWHDTQEILPQKDGSIVFEAEVAGTDEIRFWVMSWGSKAEVIEPESLRQKISAESAALLEKYGISLLSGEKPSMA
jgi:predicted DNA-binding transcriptional regulator YafY